MATSKLQRLFGNMLDKRLPEFRIRENYRPDWLVSSDSTHLELDFYIEELSIAFEIQGDQHFQYVPFFHKSEDDFKRRRKHDQEKRTLCYGRRIKLIEICTEFDAEIEIKSLEEKIKREQPKYFYQEQEQFTKMHLHKMAKRNNPSNIDNTKERRIARVERCKANLELFQSGAIKADRNKVEKWKQVIQDDGFEKSAIDV